MPVLSSMLKWVMFKRMYQIELFRKYPVDVQLDSLRQLLKKAKDTEWGKRYNYKTLMDSGYPAFRESVPVQTYEDVKPYVDRMLKGEKRLLWPTDIKWFAKSSGTTADKSKFIPVTQESLEECHLRGGKDTLAIMNRNYPENKILTGKGLIMGGSHQISKVNPDAYFGDVSAILLQNMPYWTQVIRTPELSIALMDEWEEKIEKMARSTMKDNVTSLSGVPSWTLVLIKRILEIAGTDSILNLWPNLELFIHGGVSFVPYRDEFKQLIPSKKMNYVETYNASEGFFAIQDEPDRDDMLLMLDYGVFYEFVPISELGKNFPKAYMVDEVEVGQNYALVITTNGGLWRYMVGDTVVVTSKQPFKIKISGRTKHFINAFGEEVIIDNAERALKVACERTGALISEFTAGPVYPSASEQGTHQWIIEFTRQPDDLQHFSELLDKTLQAVNSDYEAKRYKNINLIAPEVLVAPKGLFYNWLKKRGKLGGQHKIPRLANNRDYLDDLLRDMKATS